MQTNRSSTSHLKRHPNTPNSTRLQPKTLLNKLYPLIDSLYTQLLSSPPSSSQLPYFKHKIQQYRTKLMKTNSSKVTKKYLQKLSQCQQVFLSLHSSQPFSSTSCVTSSSALSSSLPSPTQQQQQKHTRTESNYQFSKYNSTIQMDLLRSTVQSKQSILKQLYQKEKGKVKSYEEVIKQQQREMDVVKERLEEVERDKGKEKVKEMIRNEERKQIKSREKKQQSSRQQSNMIASLTSSNKQNLDSNISGLSSNSLMKQLLLRNNLPITFNKTQRVSRNSSSSNNNQSNSQLPCNYYDTLIKQHEQLIVNLQNENRVLATRVETLEIEGKNREKMIRGKERVIVENGEVIRELREGLRVKEEILTELLYEKENYSDGYMKVKEQMERLKEKLEEKEQLLQGYNNRQEQHQESREQQLRIKQQQLSQFQQIIIKINKQLQQQRQRNDALTVTLQKQQQKISKLTSKYHQFQQQNKEIKLKLRTMQHKMQMYMEKYYRLQNEQIIESREKQKSRSFERNQKLYTAGTYEMSLDREQQNRETKRSTFRETRVDRYTERQRERERERYEDMSKSKERQMSRKKQVLSEIKNMVRERRNHLFQ